MRKRLYSLSMLVILFLSMFSVLFIIRDEVVVSGASTFFGNTSQTGTAGLNGYRACAFYTTGSVGGIADNITVYLDVNVGWDYNVSCAIYEYQDYAVNYAGALGL